MMHSLTRNIFEVERPEDYYCAIKGYRHNHSMMLVRVGKDEIDPDAFYITFLEVIYFEGVVKWKGVDFYIAPEDELKELLTRLGYKDESLYILLRHHRLFITEEATSGLKVKILAAKADKSSDISGGFYWLIDPVLLE